MGITDVKSYNCILNNLEDWNIKNANEHVKADIFDLVMKGPFSVITVMVESDIISKLFLNNDKTTNLGHSSKYYKKAINTIKRKISENFSARKKYFLMIYDKDDSASEFEASQIDTLLQMTSVLVIAAENNVSSYIFDDVKKYKEKYSSIEVITCGNPLYWDVNYIGKSTKKIQ